MDAKMEDTEHSDEGTDLLEDAIYLATLEKFEEEIDYRSVLKLNQDLRAAAKMMSRDEARFNVDLYYQIQKARLASGQQMRSLVDNVEPCLLLEWNHLNLMTQEKNVQKSLLDFASEYRVGKWLLSLHGVGPVISAGCLAHLDVRGRPTAGAFWGFAGLDNRPWNKGEKRPFCADLKRLCFNIGECFIRCKGSEKDMYGKFYTQRKAYEEEKNARLEYREQAEVKAKIVGKTTKAYKFYIEGFLPPGHLHARARRYCVKMFLSHLHHAMYLDYYGKEPPVPYIFTEAAPGTHTHFVEPPNFPLPTEGKTMRDLLGDEIPATETMSSD